MTDSTRDRSIAGGRSDARRHERNLAGPKPGAGAAMLERSRVPEAAVAQAIHTSCPEAYGRAMIAMRYAGPRLLVADEPTTPST